MPSYKVHVHRLDPTIAELHIEFVDLPPNVEIRGRLMGPKCPGVSTIEIAYPLQEVTHPIYRVLIPEPMHWSEEQPFVYEGPAELRLNGQTIEKITVSCGIRA